MPSERIRAMEFADFLDEWLYLALPPGLLFLRVAVVLLSIVLFFTIAFCWHLRNGIMLLGDWCRDLSNKK